MSIKNNHLKLKQQDTRSSFRSSSGQALIETILLLVVGIGLALLLMNFFGASFKDWGENQFGSYLQCLLESGELPALGGGAGACSNEYVAFGQGAGDGAGPGSGSGAGDDGAGGDGSNSDGTGGRAGAPGRVAVNGNRSGLGRRGGARRFQASSGFGSGSNPGQEVEEDSAKKKESKYSGSSEVGLPGWATQKSQRTEIKVNKVGFRDDEGFYSEEQEKQKEEGDAVTVSEEKVNSQDAKAPQSMLMKKRQPSTAAPSEADDEWTFGGFIKYIIIIAIIIGIILFLGSQLLQIKNSMDS